MNPLRRKILLYIYKFLDVSIMIVAFSFATIATHFRRNNIPFDEFLDMRIALKNFIIFLGFALLWFMIFSVVKLYNSKRMSNRLNEVLDIFKATFLGTLALFVFSILFHVEMVTPIFLVVFFTTVSSLTVLSRLGLRVFLGILRRHGRNLREVVIAGTNQRALNFAHSIESKPELGYHVLGFVDEPWAGIDAFKKSGYALVSDFKSFLPYVRKHVVDEVVINLPMKSYYEHAAEIATICEEQGINVRQFGDIYKSSNGNARQWSMEDDPLLAISNGALRGFYLEIKRIVDLFISSVILLVSSPFFMIIALLLKLTSTGPVFFVQERVGLNKRIFKIYKFRTMVADAHDKQKEIEHLNEAKGPVFKIKDDPRITAFGKILRKSSLDELPQLINVLKGEMSLIGPRPLPLRDYHGFDKDWHRRRLSVRPGLTCLWQINGRSDVDFDKWMELDLQYIDNWSPWLDIKIMLKTIPAVLKGSGAE